MTHDPLCPNSKGSCCPWMGECDCQCRCELITQVRADERWATVESAVFVASQYGCDGGLITALNALHGEP